MSSMPLILALPEITLVKILSFLTYDEIAKNRLVCTKFDQVGGELLTRGFLQAKKRHNTIHKRIKSMVPERGPERRSHFLARHCDILSDVEACLGDLTKMYLNYMKYNYCFIPGKIIDEIDRILTLVEYVNLPPPTRTDELLRELHDNISFARHLFGCVIQHLPRPKQKVAAWYFIPRVAESSTSCASTSKAPKQAIADEIHKMKKQTKANKQQTASVVDLLQNVDGKFECQSHILLRAKSVIIRVIRALPFLSSSIETYVKAPMNNNKSRKRKMMEDIDLM